MASQNMYQQQPSYNRSAYEFHQVNQQQQAQQQQRANQLTGRCGTGSVTSLHSLQSDVYQMVERPSRPNSVQQMVPSGQYQDWQVPKPRQGQLQSASMSSLNAFGPQLNQLQTAMQNAVQRNQGANPQELASAMRKMEECLQVFAQLSGAPSPSPQKMLQGAQQPVQQATQQAAPQQPQQRVLSPTNNRSQNLLQPQPEFQKREQMKKRRQRRKSDISKVDLTELRRKLESIDVSDGSDSGENDQIKNKSERPKAAGSPISDGGFYDAGSGSDSGSKLVDQDRTSVMSGYISTGSSGNSSDSGVVTPPPPKTTADLSSVTDSQLIKPVKRGILKSSARSQQLSFQI